MEENDKNFKIEAEKTYKPNSIIFKVSYSGTDPDEVERKVKEKFEAMEQWSKEVKSTDRKKARTKKPIDEKKIPGHNTMKSKDDDDEDYTTGNIPEADI